MKIKVKVTRQENAQYFKCNIDDVVDVEFEEYVAAVVASELASGNLEACKAQAVASRTFAVSRGVLDGKIISDSSATAQAYRAARYNEKYQRCIDATKATKGQILWYGKNAISAVYTASNGGRTVSSQEKWGSFRAYLPAQDDYWDIAEGQSNKWGHGVGMSQRGAKYAASQGFNYKQILEFYYPHTTLKGEYGAMDINELANKVVEAAQKCMGFPYVFGAWGEACTPANRKRRVRKEHPTIVSGCPVLSGKGTCENCKHNGQLIFDCRGFTYWCLKQVGIELKGGGATSQYNHNPNWSAKGDIKDMPNVVCCVFQKNKEGKMAHTGLHIGDGNIIHCAVGVQTGKTSNKAWTHYAIPKGLYDENEINNKGKVISMPVLRKGSSGEEVKKLQEILNARGFDCGLADGKFGAKTQEAVIAYQTAAGLQNDGIVGSATWAALLEPEQGQAQEADGKEEDVIIVDDDEEEETDIIAEIMKRLDSLQQQIDELSGKKVLGIFKLK